MCVCVRSGGQQFRHKGKSAEAFALFESAAADGSSEALGWMSVMLLLDGQGVPFAPVRGYQVFYDSDYY